MRKLAIGLAAALALASCSNEKETPKGYKFTLARKGTGEVIRPGQFVFAHFTLSDGKDSVWLDTRKENRPALFVINDTSAMRYEEGIEELFRMARRGDSIVMKLAAQTLFEKTYRQGVPPGVDPKSMFTFTFKCKDILDTARANVVRDSINAIAMAEFERRRQEQLATDLATIDEYLAGQGIVAQQDASGLRYIITKPGRGNRPTPTSMVKVNYKGSLLSTGEVFDQSESPVEFSLGQLIPGWQIGFPLLQKGAKATLFVPSALGYGERGMPGAIPANANLVFEVELIDFK
jgi:FKBP-type peptidyl-prolyl cis-trans isomerase